MRQVFYSPTQTINAFNTGMQQREQRQAKKVKNAFSQMIGENDLEGARKYAYGQGNLELGQGADALIAGQQQTEATANSERTRRAYEGVKAIMGQTDFNSRLQMATTLSQQLGIPAPDDPNDLTDHALTQQLEALRIEGGFEQAGPDYGFMNVDGVLHRTNKTDGTSTALTERYVEPEGPASPIGKIMADVEAGLITPEQGQAAIKRANAPRGPLVQNTVGGHKSLSDVPIGEFVPPDLIKGIDIPEDQYARRTDTMPGFEFVPIPGSSTQRKNETREEGLTIGTLIGDYADLDKNKAIRSRDNSFEDNLRGVVATSPPGRFWDSTVGNIENHEARDSIEGLSMNALMQMISMSDVSAKAMDSDAEMKAWLGAIKGDTFESALTKLHVLDTSFGSGNELEKAWQNGVIDEATYRYVTNRVSEDPFTAEMAARAQRYASLGGAIGTERMTQNELGSANDLLEYMSPEERALFEGAN